MACGGGAATAALGVLVFVGAACGGSEPEPLTAQQFTAEVQAICADAAAGIASIELAFNALRQAFDELPLDEEQRVQLDRLDDAIGDVHTEISSARTGLELRDFDAVTNSIAEVGTAYAAADDAAAALETPACGSDSWGPAWIEQADEIAAVEQQALEPTGDYATDVGAACDRFSADLADATLFSGDPIQRVIGAAGYRQAIELLHRDVVAIGAPEGREDQHDAFVAALDAALTVGRDVEGDMNGASAAEALSLQTALIEAIAAAQHLAAVAGVDC